jgi:hypothetical protein
MSDRLTRHIGRIIKIRTLNQWGMQAPTSSIGMNWESYSFQRVMAEVCQ